MATTTTRLSLRKPDTTDTVNVETDLNDNYDTIDTEMGAQAVASNPSSPYTGKIIMRSDDDNRVYIYNGASWQEALIVENIMAAQQVVSASDVTTSSTSYTSLSPEVGITFVAPPSGKVYVTVSGALECSGFGTAFLSYEIRDDNVSGAVVIAADDDYQAIAQQEDKFSQGSARHMASLTAGETYYCRLMSRATSGTASFFNRVLLIEPVLKV